MLAWDSQRSTGLCLLRAGVKGVYHNTQPLPVLQLFAQWWQCAYDIAHSCMCGQNQHKILTMNARMRAAHLSSFASWCFRTFGLLWSETISISLDSLAHINFQYPAVIALLTLIHIKFRYPAVIVLFYCSLLVLISYNVPNTQIKHLIQEHSNKKLSTKDSGSH